VCVCVLCVLIPVASAPIVQFCTVMHEQKWVTPIVSLSHTSRVGTLIPSFRHSDCSFYPL